MRVLNIVNQLGLGGIETGLLHTLPYLKQLGIEVDICCHGPPSILDAELESMGCEIWRISKSANPFQAARNLEKVLERRDYSLVHSRFGYTSGGIALAAARKRIPCVVSIHSSEPLSKYSWRTKPILSSVRRLWLNWNRRLMDKYVKLFIGHSCANLESFEPNWRTAPTRFRLIPNGVTWPTDLNDNKSECRRTLGLHPQFPVILHVGSFRKEKNHEGLLQIFGRVLRALPNAQLVLVGDGLLRQGIKSLAENMAVLNSVRFEGTQRNVWLYYQAADLFVFPSYTEGFGKALVESAVARLPIVASDIAAHREVIGPSQERFLFHLPGYSFAAELALAQLDAARQGTNDWVVACEQRARASFSMERFAHDLATSYGELARKAA